MNDIRQHDPIELAGVVVKCGEHRRIDIPITSAYGHAQVSLPAVVIHGRRPGPRLFVSAAIHGDELNGVEIIRRLRHLASMRKLSGTLILVPVVNVYGFITQSRYLPDRRDLNRSFPGSSRGSVASRLANVFMQAITSLCTHGIDLHTGSNHRTNLPQIRAWLDDPETERLARAFGVPVILNSNLRDGSLRQAVLEDNTPMLLYEAGEALRFDEIAIRAGVRGILGVMRALEMLPPSRKRSSRVEPMVARSTVWLRAPESGVFRFLVGLGKRVREGDLVGIISDPLGDEEIPVTASSSGLIIGRTQLPLVNAGDALIHIATMGRPGAAAAGVETFHEELHPDLAESESGEPPIL